MTGNGPSPSGRTTWTPIGPLGDVISSVRDCMPQLLHGDRDPQRPAVRRAMAVAQSEILAT